MGTKVALVTVTDHAQSMSHSCFGENSRVSIHVRNFVCACQVAVSLGMCVCGLYAADVCCVTVSVFFCLCRSCLLCLFLCCFQSSSSKGPAGFQSLQEVCFCLFEFPCVSVYFWVRSDECLIVFDLPVMQFSDHAQQDHIQCCFSRSYFAP